MAREKPLVVYWNNIPSPYVVGRFNALAESDLFNFEAWFNQPRTSRTSWRVDEGDWQFRARYVPRASVAGREIPAPYRLLKAQRPDLVVTLPHDLGFALGAAVARVHANRLALRVLPTYDAWNSRSVPKEMAKRMLFRAVDAAKVPGPQGMRQAVEYGLPMDRSMYVTQSIDVEHYAAAVQMRESSLAEIRRSMKLDGFVFLYVGRLWLKKGLDTLLSSFERVRARYPASHLLLVGTGQDEVYIRERAAGIGNVHVPGFQQRDELLAFYAAADAFVFPTLGDPNGVVVEEAMCAGLPVISSDAAGDIRTRVIDGETGFVVPAENIDALADRLMQMIANPASAAEMGRAGHRLAMAKSHAQYARDFEGFVAKTLALPKRRGPAPLLWAGLGHMASRLLTPMTGEEHGPDGSVYEPGT